MPPLSALNGSQGSDAQPARRRVQMDNDEESELEVDDAYSEATDTQISHKRSQSLVAEERWSKKQKHDGYSPTDHTQDEAGSGDDNHTDRNGTNTQEMQDVDHLNEASDGGGSDIEMGDVTNAALDAAIDSYEEQQAAPPPIDQFIDPLVEQTIQCTGMTPTFPTFRTKIPRPPILTNPISREDEKKEMWLLFSNSSPFIHTDIVELLETSWENMNAEEQAYLVSLLPEVDLSYPPDSETPTLCDRFFKLNSVLKQTCREYTEDLRDAFLDADFMKDAVRAAQTRKAGKFDAWKDNEFEVFWGQKQKLPTDIVAGGAARIPLETIIKARYLQEGDIWHYFRSFSTGVKVEKEVKCIGINADYSLNFQVPAKDNKFCDDKKGPKDIIVNNVSKPQKLEVAILRQSSKCPARIPNGNAFKVFRIVRNNLDKGALWELRQNYFERMGFE